MNSNVVLVKIWDQPVGYLSWDKKNNVAIFEYEESFIERNIDIAPLTMSIHATRSRKGIPWTGSKEKLYLGLPPMIADSLPDKWGQSLFNAWLRDNHIPVKQVSPVDHLSFIGSRGMGALTYEPAGNGLKPLLPSTRKQVKLYPDKVMYLKDLSITSLSTTTIPHPSLSLQ